MSIDTLRADHLGAYGHRAASSPALDELSRESILFERAYSQASWTLPAHASLFTSLYPSVHGVVDTDRALSEAHTTLAERLEARGYATAAFTGGGLVDRHFGFDRGFQRYVNASNPVSGQGGRFVDNEADYLRWIEEQRGVPFLLFLHGYDVHQPYMPHPGLERFTSYRGPLREMFSDGGLNRSFFERRGVLNMNFWFEKRVNRWEQGLDPADHAFLLALYDNEIRFADAALGRLLERLEAWGLWEHTILAVTSDHGEGLGEKGYYDHRALYETELHVPLIVRIPGRSPRRVSEPVELIDVMPTLLDAAGIPVPGEAQGRSLLAADADPGRLVVGEETLRGEIAARAGDLKAIAVEDVAGQLVLRELYDLGRDPAEAHNLLEEEDPPPGAGRLLARMREWRRGLPAPRSPLRLESEEARKELLRAMGYLQP